MRHCCAFEPFDVWFLKNNEDFSERKLSFGTCPICNIPLAVLVQYDNLNKCFSSIKKLGITAEKFVKSFNKEKDFSMSDLNRQKFKSNTYKWVYGVNKQLKNKIRQYAKDFYGNQIVIKELM